MTQPAGERERVREKGKVRALSQEVDSVGNWQDFLRSSSVTFEKRRLGGVPCISSGTAVGTCPTELAPGTNHAWHSGGKVREASGARQQNRKIILYVCVCAHWASRASFKSC